MTTAIGVKLLGLGVVGLCAAVCGCGPETALPPLAGGGGGGGPTVMVLESSAFFNNGPIPILYTADGQNISPPLSWSGLPTGTQELAVIVQDLDTLNFFHWVIYNIPESTLSLPADVLPVALVSNPPGAAQGLNSALTIGWTGPQPPIGQVHRYQFTLYALNSKLGLGAGVTAESLLFDMQGHVLGTAELVGTYLR